LKRLAITLLAMLSLAGCQDRRTPVGPPRVGISAALSDGVSGGNPHFFFLPPIVTQPTFSGTFDPALRPSVEICHLTIDPSCANPVLRFDPSQVTLDLTNQQYKVNWNSDPTLIVSSDTYRIRVLVGRILLGFRDVVPVSTPQQVPKDQSPDSFVFLNGSTNPIKFRIEQQALCTPGATDCGEGTINLSTGGTILATFAGIQVPAQPGSNQSVTIVIERVSCPRTADGRVAFLPMDIPQFEGCYRVRTDPIITVPLNPPATIGVCLEADALNLPANQHDLLQLHRFEPANPSAGIEVLPNAPFTFVDCSGFALGNSSPIVNLARALWHGIERHVGPWFSPPPLEAAHLGVGGLTKGFSNFGWGLPAKMTLLQGDNQTGFVGSTVTIPPAVFVTDRNGAPVQNASVHYAITAGNGSVSFTGAACASDVNASCVVTGVDGVARVSSWVLGLPNPNLLTASGIGLGSVPTETGFLPNGTVTFHATACRPGFGTATVDGVMAPGEWQCAQHADFTANLSGGATPATLYWMNDQTNLYLAVRVQRASTDKVNTLRFNFDNNNSANTSRTGLAETGDDILVEDATAGFSDQYLTANCTTSTQTSCGATDASAGGTNDGAAAFGNASGFSVYELRHPLNSGDTAHDFALSAGSNVGLFLTMQVGSGAQGNTQWPGFRRYLTITMVSGQ
jgi:hypothetical protein